MKNTKKGKLICIEGSDFCGKSTLIKGLQRSLPQIFPNEKFYFTREPGSYLDFYGSSKDQCEAIRHKLLTTKHSIEEEIQLFAESRELHTKDIIKLINEGYNVITDRYLLSSYIYQAKANNLSIDIVKDANKNIINKLNENDIQTNNIVLVLDKNTYLKRKAERAQNGLDVLEQKGDAFYDKIRNEFELCNLTFKSSPTSKNMEEYGIGNISRINASHAPTTVLIKVLSVINEIFN